LPNIGPINSLKFPFGIIFNNWAFASEELGKEHRQKHAQSKSLMRFWTANSEIEKFLDSFLKIINSGSLIYPVIVE